MKSLPSAIIGPQGGRGREDTGAEERERGLHHDHVSDLEAHEDHHRVESVDRMERLPPRLDVVA